MFLRVILQDARREDDDDFGKVIIHRCMSSEGVGHTSVSESNGVRMNRSIRSGTQVERG